jgi:hypothetical protein
MTRGKWVTLKLHQLRLDQENYRLGPQATQRDAIRAMITDQGSKLVRLAKDILQMEGISPGEPIWVVPAGVRGQYIVEEGNRRVTALKLLETPALADGTSVSKQFRRLSKTYLEHPIRDLDARLFEKREDVAPWKRRRHMTAGSGVGLDRWNTFAKGRANRDLGLEAPRSLAVVEFLADDKTEAWAEVLEALDGRWSTVDRVLNSSPFQALGVSIDPKTGIITFENGDEKTGRELLRRVLVAMAGADFEFAHVEQVKDRQAFIDRFAEYSVKAGPTREGGTVASSGWSSSPKPTADADATDSSASVTEAGAAQSQGAATTKSDAAVDPVDDAARKTLAPAKGPRVLPVQGVRLVPLYNECRKIKVKGNENAAAFLVRVFIELSSEEFLHTKSVQIPRSLRDKSITRWDDYQVKLSDKITAVALNLDPTSKAPVFVQARLAIKPESVGSFSINMLHSYFHNRHVLPDEATIKASWDGWEAYLRALHTALAEA